MAICYVVGAGEFVPRGLAPQPGDLVIAADAGYVPLAAMGITPALLVGDFDSLEAVPPGIATRTFPTHKDDTDLALALAQGWERGYRTFALYGAGGGRVDHFQANLQLLAGLSRRGAQAWLVDRAVDVFALTNGTFALPPRPAGTVVSVFCHGERAHGVTLEGLRYPLHRATLHCDRPLGVSNEYVSAQARVTVSRGTLLVFVALA